ncbi:caspase family protein [Sinorhizobium fredii]|uniref:caspase family protein n=1 Tax=Rhizobium fredii TaxID=380 RepID=UPI0004BA4D92|nr:caspase family protein [Sinorhizobium fredii]
MTKALLVLLFLLGTCLRAAAAENRLALVIGNSDYTMSRDLPAAARDAEDIGAALEGLGFQVIGGRDLDREEMVSAVDEFAKRSLNADSVLFYYAGHGLQVDGVNYLIPVDAELRAVQDLPGATVSLDSVMKTLSRSEAIRLIFLDACRNNPIPEEMMSGRGAGLASIENAAGFLVAYSTQPGNVALDGAGRNSPFAKALLSHIGKAGQDIASLMISVRRDVIAATGGFQVPWENSSLTRQFYFVPGDPDYMSPEALLFRLAGKERDRKIMEAYLSRYPEGVYAADIRSMQQQKPAPAEGEDVKSADLIWTIARSQRMKALVDIYLERFPTGAHRSEAVALQAALSEEEGPDASPGVLCEALATHPRDATANVAGVSLAELSRHADRAVEVCREAVRQFPEAPYYAALLARALAASGNMKEAIVQYRLAADRGDLRALVSLGLMMQVGDELPMDPAGAAKLYERAATGGSADGAINLAVMLAEGKLIEKNMKKAVRMLSSAAASGSAIANYNLGVLASRGTPAVPGRAADYFRQATRLGDPRGFMSLAILLDEGRGVARDPGAAADMLLRGIAADNGETLARLSRESRQWSPTTLRQLQVQLRAAGYYNGPIDALVGAGVRDALHRWRLLGPPA